jgi:hypothetical protein
MKMLFTALLLCSVILVSEDALAVPAPDTATAAVSCTVAGIMEWSGNFAGIDLADITTQAGIVTDSATITLYTNGDVDISAENTVTARLTKGSSVLVTEYRLEYDGNGTTATGGSTVDYTVYGSFLSPASHVTHISADGAVDVTLRVRASNPVGNLADAGAYTATQTLTATWGS